MLQHSSSSYAWFPVKYYWKPIFLFKNKKKQKKKNKKEKKNPWKLLDHVEDALQDPPLGFWNILDAVWIASGRWIGMLNDYLSTVGFLLGFFKAIGWLMEAEAEATAAAAQRDATAESSAAPFIFRAGVH